MVSRHATVPVTSRHPVQGTDDAQVMEIAVALCYGQAKRAQRARRGSMARNPASMVVLRGGRAPGMVVVWGLEDVNAMTDGRERTARHASRTSMVLHRVRLAARPGHRAQVTGDAQRTANALACRLGRARSARHA